MVITWCNWNLWKYLVTHRGNAAHSQVPSAFLTDDESSFLVSLMFFFVGFVSDVEKLVFLGDEVIWYGGLDIVMLVYLMVIRLRILLNVVEFFSKKMMGLIDFK